MMDSGDFMMATPLWGVFLLTTAICMGAVEAGAAITTRWLQPRNEKEPDGPVGSIVGAVLGLLAFILAFTFGMAASRLDTRKQLMLEEANALGTLYLRASLLPSAQGLEVRRLLREYTEMRATATLADVDKTLIRSAEIHRQLWDQAKQLAQTDMDSELRSLFIGSLNQVIDLHQSRLTVALEYRIPLPLWGALYLLTVLAMLVVEYQVSVSGLRRLRGTPVLAGAFSLVIFIIADIDRPGEGFIRVSPQPLFDVLESMKHDS